MIHGNGLGAMSLHQWPMTALFACGTYANQRRPSYAQTPTPPGPGWLAHRFRARRLQNIRHFTLFPSLPAGQDSNFYQESFVAKIFLDRISLPGRYQNEAHLPFLFGCFPHFLFLSFSAAYRATGLWWEHMLPIDGHALFFFPSIVDPSLG